LFWPATKIPEKNSEKKIMTSTTDYLTSLNQTLGEFRQAMSDLKMLEADEQKWKAEVSRSRQTERSILLETSPDIDDQSRRLAEARAKTAILEQRQLNIEEAAQLAYSLGVEAVQIFSGAATYAHTEFKDWASSCGIDPSQVIDVNSNPIQAYFPTNVAPAEAATRRRRVLTVIETELPAKLNRLTGMLARMESEKAQKQLAKAKA
jgi:hypothetical protein